MHTVRIYVSIKNVEMTAVELKLGLMCILSGIYVESKFVVIWCHCVVNKNKPYWSRFGVGCYRNDSKIVCQKCLVYPHKNYAQYKSCVHIGSQMCRIQQAAGGISSVRGNVYFMMIWEQLEALVPGTCLSVLKTSEVFATPFENLGLKVGKYCCN